MDLSRMMALAKSWDTLGWSISGREISVRRNPGITYLVIRS